MSEDSQKSVISSAKRFFSGTLLSRILGMFREILMAASFGAAPAVAAFWMAFRFSNLLRRLLGEGPLQASFIPLFEDLRKESPKKAAQFFRDLSFAIFSLLFIIVIVTEIVLWGILYFASPSPENAEILRLTAFMMPGICFICLFGLNMGVLQCEKSYFTPSFAPAAFNIIWISGIFIFRKQPVDQAMQGLACLVVLAFIAQWGMTVPKILSFLKQGLSGELFQGIKFFSPELSRLRKVLALSIIGVAATQVNSAVDVIFARVADPSGPAFLAYAIRLQQLPMALIGLGMAAALLPPLSRAVEAVKFKALLDAGLKRLTLVILPLSVLTVVYSSELVNLLFGHGDFSAEAVYVTGRCLACYSVGMLPMTLVFLLASAFYAKKNYRFPSFLSVAVMLCNVVLNAIFVFVLDRGAASVALATSFAAFINCVVLFIGGRRSLGDLAIIGLFKTALKAAALTCLALLLAEWVKELLPQSDLYPREILQQFVRLIPAAVAFLFLVLVYFFLSLSKPSCPK